MSESENADNSFSKISVIHLQSLVNMNNCLNCIYLNEMTRRREHFLHFESSTEDNSDKNSPEQNDLDSTLLHPDFTVDSEEDEKLLQEIFDDSIDNILYPCSLRRTSDDKDGSWTPVDVNMTPIPGPVGLGVDSDVYPSPTA